MGTAEFGNLNGLRVLVVEDNMMTQRIIGFILSEWKVSTHMATNGKIALDMLARKEYDVVLMDIMMPELDGYSTTRAIRSMDDPYYRELPIFAFSATPDPDLVCDCKMTGIISKTPINKMELFQKISPYHKLMHS